MLCDEDGATCRAYGVSSLVGGVLGFASRASVLIDAEGRVAANYPDVSVREHADEVLADLARLGLTP